MLFIVIVIFIAIISFLWAVYSLRSLNAHKEVEKVSEDLKKGKVIFSGDHSSSGSS
ncbi:MAG: hypothetical protein AAB675_04510 [Patescibacteria group bacterium]